MISGAFGAGGTAGSRRHDVSTRPSPRALKLTSPEPTNGISDVFGRYGDVPSPPSSPVPRHLRGTSAQLAAVYSSEAGKGTATLGGVNHMHTLRYAYTYAYALCIELG